MSNQPKFTAFSFDASQVQPAAPLEAIPAAFYNVAVTDGEIVPTKDGSGERLTLELTVLDGDFKGRKVFDGLNIKNKNPQAQEIAWQQLSAICHATGVLRLTDVQELYNKPFSAKIGYEGNRTDPQTGQTYEARNTFKGAKPLAAGAAAPAGVPGAVRAPAASVPAPGWVVAPGATPAAAPAQPAAPLPAAPTVPPFAAPAPVAPAPVQKVKRMVMTAKANGLTAEQFRASDPAWTDELLVREGYAVIEEVAAPAPAAPAMPAAPVAPPAGMAGAPWRK